MQVTFQELIQPLSKAQFFCDIEGQSPRYFPGAADRFNALFGWRDLRMHLRMLAERMHGQLADENLVAQVADWQRQRVLRNTPVRMRLPERETGRWLRVRQSGRRKDANKAFYISLCFNHLSLCDLCVLARIILSGRALISCHPETQNF